MDTKQVSSSDIEPFETFDFKRLFGLLRRNFWLLLAGLVLAAGAAFLVSIFQTPIYAASTQVMVTRTTSQATSIDITQSLNAQQIAQTYVELLQQKWVLDKVSERVGVELDKSQVDISLATQNTPLIYITTEDPDPNRAIQIADTLVQVLIEQNESIQSGRYSSAEASLNQQIQNMENQIAEVQSKLKQADTDAYANQLEEAQKKIQDTQAAIDAALIELTKLKSLGSTANIQSLLAVDQKRLEALQLTLNGQLAEYQAMSDDLATNPLAHDLLYGPAVQAQMAELGVAINGTRAQMDALSQDIAYLTPLAEPDAISNAINEKWKFIVSQRALLAPYNDALTALQVAGKITTTPNEVATLDNNLKLYQEIYLSLLNNRESLRLERIQNMPNVVQANPPIASEDPVRPRTLLNTILGGLAGLILALSAVMVMDFLDTTIKSREDIERAVGLSVLGYVLPMASSKDKEGPFLIHSPRSPAAEAFRSLRTNLEFIGADKPLKSILISSAGAAEGKTIIAANLALIMAQGGKKVVLLDADLRRPRLHQELGISNRVGLSDIFRGKATLAETLQPYNSLTLSVITSGGIPPNPAELLGSEKMVHILDELTAKFDMVIVDSTPTLVTDSQLIAARVDGVLLIVRVGETQSESSRNTVEQYRRVGARLLGVVLNNVVAGNSYGYSAYTNYNYYHYDENRGRVGNSLNLSSRLPWKRKKKIERTEE